MVKPPYKVPSMREIADLPWNGFKVASLFSGCGGSSLGYKLAGFKVVWANEFIPAAQEVYRLNHPGTVLCTKDIRTITEADLPGEEIDLLDGSPPCASFSTSGKRDKGWGQVKKYSDTKQRTDDLFYEYVRILKILRPKVFVAENVKGLLMGNAKGYFLDILSRLKDAGYRVKCALLNASRLGVPQLRERAIFVGVREDINKDPVFPSPLPYTYTLADACPWIVDSSVTEPFVEEGCWFDRMRTDSSKAYNIFGKWTTVVSGKSHNKRFNLNKAHPYKPLLTITTAVANVSAASVTHPFQPRKFCVAELKRLCSFPDDFELTGTVSQKIERLGRAVPPVMMYHIAKTIQNSILSRFDSIVGDV